MSLCKRESARVLLDGSNRGRFPCRGHRRWPPQWWPARRVSCSDLRGLRGCSVRCRPRPARRDAAPRRCAAPGLRPRRVVHVVRRRPPAPGETATNRRWPRQAREAGPQSLVKLKVKQENRHSRQPAAAGTAAGHVRTPHNSTMHKQIMCSFARRLVSCRYGSARVSGGGGTRDIVGRTTSCGASCFVQFSVR